MGKGETSMLLDQRRIVVIDDDVVNLCVMSSILRKNGAFVHEINPQFSQVDHITLVEQILPFMPVDLILTDIMLPRNIDGYVIFDRLRAIPELTHIPIAAVTASPAERALPKAKQQGFQGFISKPVRLASFAQHVNRIVQGEPVWIS
jgi:two-component system, cell cycle response regulator DivK